MAVSVEVFVKAGIEVEVFSQTSFQPSRFETQPFIHLSPLRQKQYLKAHRTSQLCLKLPSDHRIPIILDSRLEIGEPPNLRVLRPDDIIPIYAFKT